MKNIKIIPGILAIPIFLSLCYFPAVLWATEAIPLAEIRDYKNISSSLDYIKDETGKFEFKDIVGSGLVWKKNEKNYVNFGNVSHPLWFRFTIKNVTLLEKEWYLEINFPPINLIELYIQSPAGNVIIKKSGDSLPFKMREVDHRNHIFKLEQTSGVHTYYMRIDTMGSVSFNLNILSDAGMKKMMREELPVYWFYFGLVAVMALYNLFIFFSIRDISYLYYVLFILSFMVLVFNYQGFGQQYFWQNSTWFTNHANPFMLAHAIIWGDLFLVSYFNAPQKFPTANKITIYTILIPAILSFVISFFLEVYISLLILYVVVLWMCSFFTCYGLYLLFIRKTMQRELRIFLLAFSVLFLSVLINILTLQGILPVVFFTRWIVQLGTAFLVVVVSFGLADKMNVMQSVIHKGEKKYQHLVEGSNDIIFSMDKDLTILSINNVVFKHLGFIADEILGKNFMDLIKEAWLERSDMDRHIVEEYVNDLFRMKGSVQFRTMFVTKFSHEPKELAVKLEFAPSEIIEYTILGKASPIVDDTLLEYLIAESFVYSVNNYLQNADLLCNRLTRNLEKYLPEQEILKVRMALRELLLNAIEHGNLNLTFEEKSEVIEQQTYLKIIQERQSDSRYHDKHVLVEYRLNEQEVVYTITDEGNGFDFNAVINRDLASEVDNYIPHGRGLILADKIFDTMKFNEKGNQVIAKKKFFTE